ncbi:hypothetical protein I8J29_16130 [Paenibacillus sp. MWE-103]|uniref:Uncharacterized protein n=1 Tax=Paenibacillus artemisiicola TaxID=1172618 RepID=A0ABS3WBR4_9BACL|nr:hypothetical protein [Paenibacillus artemisiicola]MBO7745739.1 hypothetical protein [Paenibacillus artemisiicola]
MSLISASEIVRACQLSIITGLRSLEYASVFSDEIKVVSQVPMDPLYNQASNILKEEASLYLLQKQTLEQTMANVQTRNKKEIK